VQMLIAFIEGASDLKCTGGLKSSHLHVNMLCSHEIEQHI
jgi:hypothetical protein